MTQDDEDRLDRAFMALADPVRRAMVARLSRGPATVNELAEPFSISLQAVSKHIAVLEQAELVTRSRDAQRRPVHLAPDRLERLTAWIDHYRLASEQQYRRLDRLLGGAVTAKSSTAKSSTAKSSTAKSSTAESRSTASSSTETSSTDPGEERS